MSRPLWFVNLLIKSFPLRFRLARLTNLPLLGELVDWRFFEGDDLLYLPSDRAILVNESIPQMGDFVLPSTVVDHFIDKASHHWIMDFCICRQSNHCEDYPRNLGCLFLGEAVLKINPRLGRLVSREEAHAHVQKCREIGLVHLVGRTKLDAFWLGAGPGEKLLTICNCCPCCCLLKVIPELTPKISSKINRLPGVSVEVNGDCQGCGDCLDGVCFVNAIQLVNGQAHIGSECRGCGRCVEVCPEEAIELTIQESAYIQNAIERITQRVDVH